MPATLLSLLATVLGITFLLAIHEFGHYLAARAAGVRVEVFSIGIGPRLLGIRRRGCDWRLSLVPVGAYVRLAGEEAGSGPPRRDELAAQPPRWRFLIFAGGILANFLFALILIPILFRTGVPFQAPVAGFVRPGSPAWKAGLQPGDRILQADGREILGFVQLSTAVALHPAGEPMGLVVVGADGRRRRLEVVPEFDPDLGFPVIGVGQPLDPEYRVLVPEDSAAWRAGMRSGDRLRAIDGLPLADPVSAAILLERLGLATAPVPVAWERDGEVMSARLPLREPGPDDPPALGVWRLANVVQEVRAPELAEHLRPGDRILRAGGSPVRGLADLGAAVLAAGGLPALAIERNGEALELPPLPGFGLRALVAGLWLDAGDDLRVGVREGGPAWEAGLRPGDRILRVDNEPVRDFQTLARLVRAAGGGELSLLVSSPGDREPRTLHVRPRPLPVADAGFGLRLHEERVRRENLLAALGLGLQEAHRMVREAVLTLERMARGRVDSRNLGGIISIGVITYHQASAGWTRLFFFLAMLSLHLGVLNLLPIPVLDGGHLLFILLEKLLGRPVSPRTQGWLQMLGALFLLAMVAFVTCNDIRRLLE